MAATSHVVGQVIDGNARFVVLTPQTGILRDRLRLTKPRKIVNTVNGVTSTRYASDFYYVDDVGKNCKPPTTVWCMQQAWTDMSFPYKSPQSTWVEENCEGFKTAYPMQRDVEELSEEEAFTKECAEAIYDTTYDFLKQYKEEIPEDSKDALKKAEKKKDRSIAIRPIFTHRNMSKEDKTPDTSKPMVMYIDFSVYAPKDKKGKAQLGRSLKCNTKITGPKNASLDPFSICGKYGNVRVVIEWLGVNWGSPNSKKAAIIKYKLNQITWSPSGPLNLPTLLTNDDAGDADVKGDSGEEGEDLAESSSSSGKKVAGKAKASAAKGKVSDDETSSSSDDDEDFDDPFAKKAVDKTPVKEVNVEKASKPEKTEKKAKETVEEPKQVEDDEPQSSTPQTSAPAPAKKITAAERRAALKKGK